MNEEYDVIIIGAGFSGVFTAAEVAKQGLRVLLLEKSPDIIPTNSSSFNECYKLHTGLHYAGDLKTATHCLENSVYFAKKYKDFLLGADDPNLPWRRGRFYIPADTLVSAEDTKSVAAVLKNKYKSLCKKDPTNKVFGEPEHFLTELSPEQYQEINPALTAHALSEEEQPAPAKIIAAFETPESQIDLPRIKQYFQEAFAADPNISLKFNTEALRIAPLTDRLGYTVQVKNVNTGTISTIDAKAIINCTWQNIEYFEQQLGYFVPNDSLIRTKISIRVKLPEALTDIHTAIVATGPFVSITNLGDGTAILTSEKVTNVGYYPAGSHNYHSKPPAKKEGSDPLITQLSQRPEATPLPDSLRLEGLQLTAPPAQTLTLSSEKILEKQLHHPDTDEDYRRLLERLLPTYLKLIRNELTITEGEGKQLADKILEDCSYYVPGLAGSEILDLRVGHVKMPDKKRNYNLDSIHHLQSSIHARQESGAEAKDLCYWSNSGMKMTYVLANAEKLSHDLRKHLEIFESITRFLEKLGLEIYKRLRYIEKSAQERWKYLIKPLLYVTYKQILFTEYSKGLTELEEKYLFTKLVYAVVDKIIQSKDIKAYHPTRIATPLASTSAAITSLATPLHFQNPVEANLSNTSDL